MPHPEKDKKIKNKKILLKKSDETTACKFTNTETWEGSTFVGGNDWTSWLACCVVYSNKKQNKKNF